jgi:hypothetical protein
MARGNGKKPKQDDIEKAIDRKNSELTPDEKRALHIAHIKEYTVAADALKKAQAKIKNVGKRIKAEGGSVAQVKQSILAQTPEGEAALKADMESTAQVLRWAGVEVGETIDMFPVDRRPSEDRAFDAGKLAGMRGDDCRPPHDPSVPQYQRWLDGWHAAQEILLSGFRDKVTVKDDVEGAPLPKVDTSERPFAPN